MFPTDYNPEDYLRVSKELLAIADQPGIEDVDQIGLCEASHMLEIFATKILAHAELFRAVAGLCEGGNLDSRTRKILEDALFAYPAPYKGASNDWTDFHPKHDRTSCSDSNPCNADPEGSTGCARCTALIMNRATMPSRPKLDEKTKKVFDFAKTITTFEGYNFRSSEPYLDINGSDLWMNTEDFSNRTEVVYFIFNALEYVIQKAKE